MELKSRIVELAPPRKNPPQESAQGSSAMRTATPAPPVAPSRKPTSNESSRGQPATTPAQEQPAASTKKPTAAANDKPESPVHPFRNVREPAYAPPHDRNYAAVPPQLGKDKETAYCLTAPIQDAKIAEEVYNRSMTVPCITISYRELLFLSPEVRQKVREVVTPKRIIATNARNTLNVAVKEFRGC